ncbi:FHA domain-containing protein [Hasllibacter sp. MH4015]|uniref:FHA domain-containing protein n=1 Tax=Hasllibacter sp. MH4015 TaxID=2854029 RepID=UPI001CD670A1|nr:FHA domain-containing protein [Hasllibacter sp. MH4015]
MAKKPILTDDELDGGIPGTGDVPPPPLPPARAGSGTATRPLDAAPPPPPAPPAATRPLDTPEPPEAEQPPAVAEPAGRDASGHARPKTRIHGYGGAARDAAEQAEVADAPDVPPVVGWLVVTEGPGRGASLPLVAGMNSIGRGKENAVQVDFGDATISRDPHAFVTYDAEARKFHLSHGGKTNIVYLNDAPVLASETLENGAQVRIGATHLRFVAFCGPDFDWADA